MQRSAQDAPPSPAGSGSPPASSWASRVQLWVGETPHRAGAARRTSLKWLGIVTCLAVYLTHALRIRHLFLGNACDDAFISFRYLRLLVDHGELAYNLGERVEGYSNLLWILLLAPLDLVGLDLQLASQLLGLALGLSTIVVAVIALRTRLGVQSYSAQLTAAILLSASGHFAAWSVMGLESMLHAFLLMLAWLDFMHEVRPPLGMKVRQGRSAVWLGALVMTRPEGLLIAAAALFLRIVNDLVRCRRSGQRPSWRFYLILLGIVGAFELFRVLYFGPYLWPNAVRAKVGHSSQQITRGLKYVYKNFLQHEIYLLLPLALVGRWIQTHPTRAAGFVLFLGYLAFFAIAGGDWSVGRFFAPLLAPGVLCFACMCDELVAAADKPRPWRVQLGCVATSLLLGYFTYYGTSQHGEQHFARSFAALDARRIELGKWIAKHTDKNAKVGLYAAGQIAYYADRYAHDMLGLNDAHIAKLQPESFGKGPAGHEKYDVQYTLHKVRPTILVQPELIPGMKQDPKFHKLYKPLPGFPQTWILRDAVTLDQSAAR